MKTIKSVISVFLTVCVLGLCACGQSETQQETAANTGQENSAIQTGFEESPAAQTGDAYVSFFAEAAVHDLRVEISIEDWQAILDDPEAKAYCSATVSIDGIELTEVGFRTRGNSSLRMALRRRSERYPFRLKFDEYVENQRFLGLDELTLTNSNDDPSYLRELLGYEAFRQLGMDVPLVTFFDLYINGELHGLYVGVEAIDKRFLERVFGEHGGNLYEAGLQATLMPNMDLALMEQKKGGGESKSDVSELIRILDEMELGEKGEIESILNVDSALKYFAANAVLHNWDDYAGQFAHNYYLYMYEGRFQIIPWDMNESFLQTEAYYQESDGARQDIASPITGEAALEERPLVEKLLAVSEYYERYLSYCQELLEWLDALAGELPGLQERINDSVRQDPTSFFSYEEFERQFDSGYLDGLAGFIAERADYLEERLPELADALR